VLTGAGPGVRGISCVQPALREDRAVDGQAVAQLAERRAQHSENVHLRNSGRGAVTIVAIIWVALIYRLTRIPPVCGLTSMFLTGLVSPLHA
jgi:hypothetical protein